MTTYVWRDGQMWEKDKAPPKRNEVAARDYFKPTIEYVSPLSGKTITDRGERREEMKVFGVREVDPSECRNSGYKNERFMQKHGLSNERNSGRIII